MPHTLALAMAYRVLAANHLVYIEPTSKGSPGCLQVMVPADAVQLRIGNNLSTLSDTCQGETTLAAAMASMTHDSMLGAEGPLQELTSPDALLQFADAHMYDSHVHDLGLSSL